MSNKQARRARRAREQMTAERVAYHEAGHAVMARLHDMVVNEVRTIPGDGVVNCSPRRHHTPEQICEVMLAGCVAALLHEDGRTPPIILYAEARLDYEDVVRWIGNDDPRIRMLERNVRRRLKAVWEAVECLAERLIPGTALGGDQVEWIAMDALAEGVFHAA